MSTAAERWMPFPKSIQSPRALLTEDVVIMIRAGGALREWAQKLGVSMGCVHKAKYRQTWRHVK